MKIRKIEWRNVASYGNKKQTIEMPEIPGLIQVVGENGVGKCVHPETRLKIRIPEENGGFEKLMDFLSSRKGI